MTTISSELQAATEQATAVATTVSLPAAEQTFIIIRDFQPGQVVRVAFITTAQAKALPAIPADALQIAVAPAGGLS